MIIHVPPQVLPDGTGVYVGGERGGLAYLSRAQGDGSLTLENTWLASDFNKALEVYVCEGDTNGERGCSEACRCFVRSSNSVLGINRF